MRRVIQNEFMWLFIEFIRLKVKEIQLELEVLIVELFKIIKLKELKLVVLKLLEEEEVVIFYIIQLQFIICWLKFFVLLLYLINNKFGVNFVF